MRALVVSSWALVLLAGCEVLGPVVGTRDGGMPDAVCLDRGRCDEPVPAPPTAPPRERLALPTVDCDDPEIVHVTESAALEVDVGACIEVHVDGAGAQEVRLTVGDALRAHLTVIAERKTTLEVRVLEASMLRVTGEVDVVLEHALTSAIVQLSLAPSGAVPTLIAHTATWSDVLLDAPDASVILRSVELSRVDVVAERFTAERGSLLDVVLRATSVELLSTSLSGAHLDVGHLASTGSRWDGCVIARCDGGWLLGDTLDESDLAASSAPLELEDTVVEETLFRGEIHATNTLMTGGSIGGDVVARNLRLVLTVLRGARVEDVGGVLTSVSLCGTTDVLAGVLSCPHCEPAPMEACIDQGVDPAAVGCPGLCDSWCRETQNACP